MDDNAKEATAVAAAAAEDRKEEDSSDSSDVEITGMELDDDEEEDQVEDEEEVDVAAKTTDNDDEDDALANEEAEELEQARQERLELMQSEKEKIQGKDREHQAAATPAERLEYLVAQSDVFAHFLAGSVAASQKKKRGGGGRGSGKANRMTEAEEDEVLLKSAQSKRRVVRLNQQPKLLADHCKMHSYQLEGLNWLIKLHDHGINGVLADEMYGRKKNPVCIMTIYILLTSFFSLWLSRGLGKTLQTISLLAYLRESRGVRGPHLVIVPKSVVGNWIREFHKWCPTIKAIRMGGTKAERQKFVTQDLPLVNGKRQFDVLVTSYEGLLKEKGKLRHIDWKYLIIDEAHRIKNENSSLSLAVRTIPTQFRLLITGTPLQVSITTL